MSDYEYYDDDDDEEEPRQTVYIDDDDDDEDLSGEDDYDEEEDDDEESDDYEHVQKPQVATELFIPKEVPKTVPIEQPPKRKRTYVPRPKKPTIIEPEIEEKPLIPVDLGPNMLPTAQMVLQQRRKELTSKITEGKGPCPICWEMIRDKEEKIRHIFAHDNALSLLQIYYAEKDPSILMDRQNDEFDEMLEQLIILKCADEDEENQMMEESDDDDENSEEEEDEYNEWNQNHNEDDFIDEYEQQPSRYKKRIHKFRKPRIPKLPLNFMKKIMIPGKRPDLNDYYPNYSITDHERRKIENYNKNHGKKVLLEFKNELPLCPFCYKSSKTLEIERVADFIRHIIVDHQMPIRYVKIGHDPDTIIRIMDRRTKCLYCPLNDLTPTQYFYHSLTRHPFQLFERNTHLVHIKLYFPFGRKEIKEHYHLGFTTSKLLFINGIFERKDNLENFPKEKMALLPEKMIKRRKEFIKKRKEKRKAKLLRQKPFEEFKYKPTHYGKTSGGLLSSSREHLQKVIIRPHLPYYVHKPTTKPIVVSRNSSLQYSSSMLPPPPRIPNLISQKTPIVSIQKGTQSMLRTTDSGSSSSSTQIRKTNEPPKIVHRVVRPIGGRMPIVRKLRPPLKVGQRPSGPRMMIRHVTPIRHVKPIKPGIPQQIVKTVVVQPKIVTVRPATTKKEAGNSQIEKVEKSSMESPKPSSSTSTQSVEAVPTTTEVPSESSTTPAPETKPEASAATQPPEDEDAEINVVD